jgi:hypothetical protein
MSIVGDSPDSATTKVEQQSSSQIDQHGSSDPDRSSLTRPPASEEPENDTLERLGRERPPQFKSAWAEVLFVYSILASQFMAVSYENAASSNTSISCSRVYYRNISFQDSMSSFLRSWLISTFRDQLRSGQLVRLHSSHLPSSYPSDASPICTAAIRSISSDWSGFVFGL